MNLNVEQRRFGMFLILVGFFIPLVILPFHINYRSQVDFHQPLNGISNFLNKKVVIREARHIPEIRGEEKWIHEGVWQKSAPLLKPAQEINEISLSLKTFPRFYLIVECLGLPLKYLLAFGIVLIFSGIAVLIF